MKSVSRLGEKLQNVPQLEMRPGSIGTDWAQLSWNSCWDTGDRGCSLDTPSKYPTQHPTKYLYNDSQSHFNSPVVFAPRKNPGFFPRLQKCFGFASWGGGGCPCLYRPLPCGVSKLSLTMAQ